MFLARRRNVARIFLSRMKEEKSQTKAEQLRKTADQAVLATEGLVNHETMKAADQEPALNIVRTLHHARWWQAQDEPHMQKAAITVISMII